MALSTPTSAAPVARIAAGGRREVALLAYPVVLTQMSQTAMGVVDSAIVGRLGATELGAVGFANIWTWTLFAFFFGTAGGVQTFVSQADGARDTRACGPWAWQGFYAVVPATLVVVALLAPLVPSLVAWLGPSPELQAATATYFRARLPGEVSTTVIMLLSAFFRGFGDTRTPLYATLLANAVLDYGLVFGELGLPRWGVAGAGYATAVGNTLGAALLVAAFRRRAIAERYGTGAVAPDRRAIARFLRTGAPIGGQFGIAMTSFAMFTTLVARMGDVSMAASQAFVMLLSLSFMQVYGISTAAATLVGRYIGAGDLEAAKRSLRSALQLGAWLAGAVALLFATLPGPLFAIFTDAPAVIALGPPLLLIGAFYQLFDAAAIIVEGALRGAGDTRWPFLVESALGWGLLVPGAYLCGVVWEGGLLGAWAAGLVHVAVLSVLLLWRFRSGAWQRIRI